MKNVNKATIAIAAVTGFVLVLWALDARAERPTPTEYCNFMGEFAMAVGTDRDQGVTKRVAVDTLLTDGGHLAERIQDDFLTAIDIVYLVDGAPPGEVAGLVFDICQETYGEPL